MLSQSILDIQKRKNNFFLKNRGIFNAWNFYLEIYSKDENYFIKNLRKTDLPSLFKFKNLLSSKSRELFCPYPWEDDKRLKKALASAVENVEKEIDASFVIKKDEDIIGHFFLWKLRDNQDSKKSNLQISEIGLAIADQYQKRGLGSLAIKILQEIAKKYKNDAVELTTDSKNKGGWQTYINNGFEYTNIIINPLEVDVTNVAKSKIKPKKFRKEKQMVYIINKSKREIILKYLQEKRKYMKLYYRNSKVC